MSAVIPRGEFKERVKKCQHEAVKRGLDALFVMSRGGVAWDGHANILYLANHYTTFPVCLNGRGHAIMVIPIDGDPVLLVDHHYYREDLVAIDDVRVTYNLLESVIEILKEKKLTETKVGLVGGDYGHYSIPVGFYKKLTEKLPKVQFDIADDILERMRSIKSDNELKIIRKLGGIATKAGEAFLNAVKPGKTEAEVAASVAEAVITNGGVVWALYINCDWQPLKWHFYDADRKLKEGDMIHAEMWGTYQGYIFDFARTAVVGAPTKKQKEFLEIASGTVKIALEKVKPGITAEECAKMIHEKVKGRGYIKPTMSGVPPGFYGHGLGLAMTDRPWIQPGDKMMMEPGMYLAIEKAMSEKNFGCAMYEDNFILTKDGIELLTKC